MILLTIFFFTEDCCNGKKTGEEGGHLNIGFFILELICLADKVCKVSVRSELIS